MALDAAQILRQTYASGAERIDISSLMRQTEPQAVARGELMGTAVVFQEDPMAELMDSMEELSFQFEEKTAKRVGERRLGEMQGPRSALVKAIETWMSMMPDMPGRDFITRLARGLRSAAGAGNLPDARELLKELARGSTDPSHQFAMLDILEQAFGEGEDALRVVICVERESFVDIDYDSIRSDSLKELIASLAKASNWTALCLNYTNELEAEANVQVATMPEGLPYDDNAGFFSAFSKPSGVCA